MGCDTSLEEKSDSAPDEAIVTAAIDVFSLLIQLFTLASIQQMFIECLLATIQNTGDKMVSKTT